MEIINWSYNYSEDVDYMHVIEVLDMLNNLDESGAEWLNKVSSIYEKMLEINKEIFSYPYLDIAGSEANFIHYMYSHSDYDKLCDSMLKWADAVGKRIILRKIKLIDGRLCLDELIDKGEDYFYIVCTNGIGDTLYFNSLLRLYKDRNNIGKICMVAKENQSCIPTWFDAVDMVIASDELNSLLNEWAVINSVWRLDNFMYGNFRKKLSFFVEDELSDFIIDDFKEIIFGLSKEDKLAMASFDRTGEEAVKRKYPADKKTILIMPYAATSKLLPEAFWENLANVLNKAGFRVYCNVKGDSEKIIDNTTGISENINNIALVAGECLAVIGLRSGLCDVLAMTNTPMVVIDTNIDYYNKWNLANIEQYDKIHSLLYLPGDDLLVLLKKVLAIFNITID